MLQKELSDISWLVDEPTYRADYALSYSILSKFEREGFNGLNQLFDKIETPSLTFGSAVDAIITGGQEEFDNNFIVADFPKIEDSVKSMVNELFRLYSVMYSSLDEIPDNAVIDVTNQLNYQPRWRPETRARVIKEKGGQYYNILFLAGDKHVIDINTNNDVLNCVEALRTSNATKFYFGTEDDDRFKRYYQLKFKATFKGIDYRCMADLIIVDYKTKKIYPIDLKTSSRPEWDFYQSFIQWHYQLQARLYYRIIKDNLDKDDYFKDFELMDYTFIVVNRKTVTPLTWFFPMTQLYGDLFIKTDKGNNIIFKDPEDLGQELTYYLDNDPKIPIGINKNETNNIVKFIKETL